MKKDWRWHEHSKKEIDNHTMTRHPRWRSIWHVMIHWAKEEMYYKSHLKKEAMKKTTALLALCLILASSHAFAQAENFKPDYPKTKELLQKGKRVFVTGDDDGVTQHIKSRVASLKRWEMAKTPDSADFTIYVKSVRIMPSEFASWAVFIDSKTTQPFNETVRQTTLSKISFNGKKAAAKIVMQNIQSFLKIAGV